MPFITTNSSEVKEIKSKFLIKHDKPLLHKATNSKKHYTIYIIENLIDGKIYIGKTSNLTDRSGNYIWKCLNYEKHKDRRPIIESMHDEGIENFRMYPIATYDTKAEVANAEMYYINAYGTDEPFSGYNVAHDGYIRTSLKGIKGVPHTTATKIMKAKFVACINLDTKDIIVSAGMKIFADYMYTSKDIIKNSARRPCKYSGYYIIYLNQEDRNAMLEKIRIKYANYKRPKKELANRVDEYYECVKFVEAFDQNPEVINDLPDYKFSFLSYGERDFPKFYDIREFIDNFFKK